MLTYILFVLQLYFIETLSILNFTDLLHSLHIRISEISAKFSAPFSSVCTVCVAMYKSQLTQKALLISFLLINTANPCGQLEPVAKSTHQI